MKPEGYHKEEEVSGTLMLRAYTMSWYWYLIWLTLMLLLSLLWCFMLCVYWHPQLRKRQLVYWIFLSDKEKLTPIHNCWCQSYPFNTRVWRWIPELCNAASISKYTWMGKTTCSVLDLELLLLLLLLMWSMYCVLILTQLMNNVFTLRVKVVATQYRGT